MEFTKKDYIDTIKEMKIDEGDIIEYNESNDIEIHIKGKKMQKLSKEISLKSIYDLVINSIENSNKRFDVLEKNISNMKIDINQLKNDNREIKQDISNMKTDINQLKNDNKEIKQRLTIIESDVKELKSLPTIAKELDHNNFL